MNKLEEYAVETDNKRLKNYLELDPEDEEDVDIDDWFDDIFEEKIELVMVLVTMFTLTVTLVTVFAWIYLIIN